jgi:ABC-type branched-subunit amino acid transport system ATPase component
MTESALNGTGPGQRPPVRDALLEARELAAGYHGHPVVRGVSLVVRSKEIVALIGPNGAGKSTTLRTLAGDLPRLGGEIRFLGEPARGALHMLAKRGIGYVPEERSVFPKLTTAENLKVGLRNTDRVLELFPELRPLLRRRAGLLSGGEQQMLSLGRALAREPRVLIADELSLGLAPLVVTRLLKAVRDAADAGIGVLLVEQHVRQALQYADYVCVMRRGEIVVEGPRLEIASRVDEIEATYFATP